MKILISKIFINEKNNKARLNVEIKIENNTHLLWYEVDEKHKSYLCDDRCDGIVINLLPLCIRKGYDIESNYPISEKLWYNLTYHVIPQLSLGCKGKRKAISINANLTTKTYDNCNLVAFGMSCGVDSFATLYEYNNNKLDNYNINCFTYYNAGAHHGGDKIDGIQIKSKYKREELYNGQLKQAKQVAKECGYPLIEVNSNINQILIRIFGVNYFYQSHTYRNLGITLLLQKKISKYYYSSAYNLDKFKVSLYKDSAEYEKYLIPFIETENIKTYSSNQNWSRLEKLQNISTYDKSYDNLLVCLIDKKNCGKCTKCKRTLMELDVLGLLEKYKKSFDIEEYINNDRERWFKDIYYEKKKDAFLNEIYHYAKKTNFKYLPKAPLNDVIKKILRREKKKIKRMLKK